MWVIAFAVLGGFFVGALMGFLIVVSLGLSQA